MKHFIILLLILVSAVAAQAADVGVSVSVGQPGFYGHIDVGNFPRPQIINPRPVIIAPPARRVVEQPIYMRVPPGHAKHWRKHCHEYNACGRPVYFVKDRWYRDVYVPRYQESRGRHDGGHGRGPERNHGGDRGYGGGHGGGNGHGRR